MPVRFDRCHTLLQRDALVIFLFHGVIPEQLHKVRNYTKKHLQKEEFEIALRNLRVYGNVLSITEIVDILTREERFPEYGYAITFDDGFENNLTVAAPVLRRYETPATFYVCSSFVDQNRMSWTDQIENVFEQVDAVKLSMPELGPPSTLESVEDKIGMLDRIRAHVKNNPTVDPYEFAAAVTRSLGSIACSRDRWLDQKLNWGQVTDLAQDPLFEVGAHGHSHKILSYLPDDELKFEITESVGQVSRAVGHRVQHFSYPEGLANCYSARVIANLKAEGIRCSPTAIEGSNPRGSDPFHLRRLFVI